MALNVVLFIEMGGFALILLVIAGNALAGLPDNVPGLKI